MVKGIITAKDLGMGRDLCYFLMITDFGEPRQEEPLKPTSRILNVSLGSMQEDGDVSLDLKIMDTMHDLNLPLLHCSMVEFPKWTFEKGREVAEVWTTTVVRAA